MPSVTLSLALSEAHSASAGNAMTMEHTILREGEWKHPKAPGGKLTINQATLAELEGNFRAGVGLAADRIPFHVGHTESVDDRAAAWADVKVVDDPERPGKKKMVALASYTTPADFEKVKSGQYAFVSPSIDFGYMDKESGTKYGAVLRNTALTNYPYLKKMGPAKVVNLSEIAEEEGDAYTVGLADGYDGSTAYDGTKAGGDPNPDGLPKGYDLTALPNECRTCARLGNDCPFAQDEAADDLALKTAAAESGNCPQYVEADGQTPGGGGAADAASQSPATNRGARPGISKTSAKITPMGRVPMSDKPDTKPSTTKRTITMTEAQIQKLKDQVEANRQKEHDAFVIALSEKHGLPADALTAVKNIFETGHKVSIALSEALDGQTVALSEKEEGYDMPASTAKELARVDLSDAITISRGELRDLLATVSEATRTQLSEGDTKIVDGKPVAKPADAVALSEFEGLSPAETVKAVNAASAAGKIK